MGGQENGLPTGTGGADRCPLIVASAILGRKWHPVIVQVLLDRGPLGFADLEAGIHDISSKVLSESLADLVEKGLIERTVIGDRPVRVEYSLTKHGRDLEGALDELHGWGSTYLSAELWSGESTV